MRVDHINCCLVAAINNKLNFLLAEKFLITVEGNKNYPILLLQLINSEAIELTIRVAGAVNFKNYVKRNWAVVSNYIVILNLHYFSRYFLDSCKIKIRKVAL